MNSFQELLDPGKVARLLGVETETLGAWRRKGYGPRWYRIGRKIKYAEADLRDWINAQIYSIDTQNIHAEVERRSGEATVAKTESKGAA